LLGHAVASKFVDVVLVLGLGLLLTPHESLASLVVIGVNSDAAVAAVEVQELVDHQLLEEAVEKFYSCVLDYFAAYEWVGLGGYTEFEPLDDKYVVVPLY
jgi:hypothetical protein